MSLKDNKTKAVFIKTWQNRQELLNNYWTRSKPKNQVQLAFRNHWLLFKQLMKNRLFNKGRRCLEVGCGRGTISAYFGDNGFKCTLLDISVEVIKAAKHTFKMNGLKGRFIVGDAKNLEFCDNSFDVVVSIGLLEHIREIEKVIKEQIRVLDKGGIFLGYIVPKYKDNVQKEYGWINQVIKGYVRHVTVVNKEPVYRSNRDSKSYLRIMKNNGLVGIKASGVYPLPMISHSIEFPFTLMPEYSERVCLEYFKQLLRQKRKASKKNPWLCKEGYGQAFLVWGFKK